MGHVRAWQVMVLEFVVGSLTLTEIAVVQKQRNYQWYPLVKQPISRCTMGVIDGSYSGTQKNWQHFFLHKFLVRVLCRNWSSSCSFSLRDILLLRGSQLTAPSTQYPPTTRGWRNTDNHPLIKMFRVSWSHIVVLQSFDYSFQILAYSICFFFHDILSIDQRQNWPSNRRLCRLRSERPPTSFFFARIKVVVTYAFKVLLKICCKLCLTSRTAWHPHRWHGTAALWSTLELRSFGYYVSGPLCLTSLY